MGQVQWARRLLVALPADVWSFSLNPSQEIYRECRSVLSEAEIARVQGVENGFVADGFVIRRGTARFILGGLLGICPCDVPIGTGASGKPLVLGSDCDFSVSSSRDEALFGFRLIGRVGIDLEWIDPGFDFRSLASSMFRDGQRVAELNRLEFFEAWVKVEAFAKALGYGLSEPLENVADRFTERFDAGDLRVEVLRPEEGFAGAVVTIH